MRDTESGVIDLIYADPPFNTGKSWGQFNDKWEGGMKGYLKFMEPRLQEMHRFTERYGEPLPPLRHQCKPLSKGYDGWNLWNETF